MWENMKNIWNLFILFVCFVVLYYFRGFFTIYVNPFNIKIFNYNGELIQVKHTFKSLVWTLGPQITMIVKNIDIKGVDINWASFCYKLFSFSSENNGPKVQKAKEYIDQNAIIGRKYVCEVPLFGLFFSSNRFYLAYFYLLFFRTFNIQPIVVESSKEYPLNNFFC